MQSWSLSLPKKYLSINLKKTKRQAREIVQTLIILLREHPRVVKCNRVKFHQYLFIRLEEVALTRLTVRHEFKHHQRLLVFSWARNYYPHCLVLVGSRNRFKRVFTAHTDPSLKHYFRGFFTCLFFGTVILD